MSQKIEPKKLRSVAGGFATGITVALIEDSQNNIKGITANSFVSISLDPPLVMLSIGNTADFFSYCELNKKLSINILSEDQKVISNQFAGFNEEDIEVSINSSGGFHILENCLAWYKAEIKQIIPAGDHHIVLCQVLDVHRDDESRPLLYYKGYRGIGEEV